jgi:hypothetical protein
MIKISSSPVVGALYLYVDDKLPIASLYRVRDTGTISETEFCVLPLSGENLGALALRALNLSVESKVRDLVLSENLLSLSWDDLLAYLGKNQKSIYARIPLIGMRLYADGSLWVHLDFFSKTGVEGDSRDIVLTADEVDAGGAELLDSIIQEFVADFYAQQA